MSRSATGSVSSFPIPQLLLALGAFYVVVTYQFFRARSLVDQLPADRQGALVVDPAGSLLVEWLSYLVSATIGEWGQSLYYAEAVTTVLVATLPWAGVLTGVAVVAGLVAHWGQSQLEGDRLPGWLLSSGVYVVVYVVGLFVLTASARGAAGFYLGQAQQIGDLALKLGARRLVSLAFLVGALLLSVAKRYTTEDSFPA